MVQYVLVASAGDGSERRFELELSRSYRIGSHPDNDIAIDQKDVSRHHAILRVFAGRFHVTDLNSKNGTYVNGRRVVSAELQPGDQLQLSSARLVVAEATADSGSLEVDEDDRPTPPELRQDTIGYQVAAEAEDLAGLLELVSRAVARGSAADPLTWAVESLGLRGALVMLRDLDGNVGVVSSAGDLGDLLTNGEVLARLAEAPRGSGMEEARLREVGDLGDPLLVCSLQTGHCLVLRLAGPAPAITHIRGVMAAVEVVLRVMTTARHGRGSRPARADAAGPASTSISPPHQQDHLPSPEQLLSMELSDARETFERWFLGRVLEQCDGNQARAARQLGMSRAGLFKKLRKLKIHT